MGAARSLALAPACAMTNIFFSFSHAVLVTFQLYHELLRA
jgi:hypothetical protein